MINGVKGSPEYNLFKYIETLPILSTIFLACVEICLLLIVVIKYQILKGEYVKIMSLYRFYIDWQNTREWLCRRFGNMVIPYEKKYQLRFFYNTSKLSLFASYNMSDKQFYIPGSVLINCQLKRFLTSTAWLSVPWWRFVFLFTNLRKA